MTKIANIVIVALIASLTCACNKNEAPQATQDTRSAAERLTASNLFRKGQACGGSSYLVVRDGEFLSVDDGKRQVLASNVELKNLPTGVSLSAAYDNFSLIIEFAVDGNSIVVENVRTQPDWNSREWALTDPDGTAKNAMTRAARMINGLGPYELCPPR